MSNSFTDVQSILFDMDGVLFFSTNCHERAYREVLGEVGIDDFSYIPIAGMRTDEAMKKIFHEHGREITPGALNELVVKKHQKSLALLRNEGMVAEGSQKLISDLMRKYRLVLASSASPQTVQLFLKKSGYAQAFEYVIDGSMVKQAKPAPDIYTLAAKRLGLAPKQCVVIEDAVSGVRAAQAAGIPVIAIVPENRQELFVHLKPDMILSKITELTVLLR